MLTRSIQVPRTARFHLSAEPGPGVTEVWYLLHGYAALAGEFLEACDVLAAPHRLLVAPEGLSRFYRRSTSGSVGASWMTREDREAEIRDHVGYLDRVRAALADELSGLPAERVLGFSQGAATACRWAALGARPFDRLVLWGGGVPPDLDLEASRARLEAAELALVVGRRDEWIGEAAVLREEERLRRAELPFRLLRYDGGHAIDGDLLASLA